MNKTTTVAIVTIENSKGIPVMHAAGCQHIKAATTKGQTVVDLGEIPATEVTGVGPTGWPDIPSKGKVAACALEAAYPRARFALQGV